MNKNELTKQNDKNYLLFEIRYLYGLNENAHDLVNLYFYVNQEESDSFENELFRLQHDLVEFIFENEFLKKYQPYWKYRRSFLKNVISIIENYNQEVNEFLFESYISLINDPISTSNQELHKYFIVLFDKDYDNLETQQKPVIIQQYASIIAEGTTGLHVWPAAFRLLEYLNKNKYLTIEKNILELGAGLGLLGLSCLITGKPKHFVFTDSHSLVLNQLENNVLYNFEKDSISRQINRQEFENKKITLVRLDWTDCTDCELFTKLNGNLNIDLIIASDIIFDPQLMPHLAKTLSYIWKRVNKSCLEFIIASTIRNQNTYDKFTDCMKEENFTIKILEFFDSGKLKQEQGSIEILKITKCL